MCGNATEENTPHFPLRMEAELNDETLVTRHQFTLPCHNAGCSNVVSAIIAMIKANLIILFVIEAVRNPQ
jgi:hypothetical protein